MFVCWLAMAVWRFVPPEPEVVKKLMTNEGGSHVIYQSETSEGVVMVRVLATVDGALLWETQICKSGQSGSSYVRSLSIQAILPWSPCRVLVRITASRFGPLSPVVPSLFSSKFWTGKIWRY